MTGRLREFNTPGPSGGVRGRAKNCLKNKSQRISSLTCFCYSDAPISLTWRAAASLFAQVVAFLLRYYPVPSAVSGPPNTAGLLDCKGILFARDLRTKCIFACAPRMYSSKDDIPVICGIAQQEISQMRVISQQNMIELPRSNQCPRKVAEIICPQKLVPFGHNLPVTRRNPALPLPANPVLRR